MKKLVVSVINDLVTDQRVHRVCMSLTEMGFLVLLVGRKLKDSLPMQQRPYVCKRMKLLFSGGPLFYLEFNIRLFFFLLFKAVDILHANDLDTLAANYLVSKIRKKELVYDSHEYFTGVPELAEAGLKRKVWKSLEAFILPGLKYSFTVNDSIARLYRKEYGIDMQVMRNVPAYREHKINKSRRELGLPDKRIILLQGAGINIQRGVEEMICAMKYIPDAVFIIIGGGDVMHKLRKLTEVEGVTEKVLFIPKQPFEKLYEYTVHADLGISIDKDTNINYRYSLPNKLFDYIHARIPVLVSDLPEVAGIVKEYKVGSVLKKHDPLYIAKQINYLFDNAGELASYKENTKFASSRLCWENESNVLKKVYRSFV